MAMNHVPYKKCIILSGTDVLSVQKDIILRSKCACERLELLSNNAIL